MCIIDTFGQLSVFIQKTQHDFHWLRISSTKVYAKKNALIRQDEKEVTK